MSGGILYAALAAIWVLTGVLVAALYHALKAHALRRQRMDIEERANQWARHYALETDLSDFGPGIHEALVIAYLAGSAQTQRDYAAHYA